MIRFAACYLLFTIARRMANPRVAANVPQNTAVTVEPVQIKKYFIVVFKQNFNALLYH